MFPRTAAPSARCLHVSATNGRCWSSLCSVTGQSASRAAARPRQHATTIHKSQGSEYPAVAIPVTMQHYMMLQRNLLYTGVTRGKQLVILLGQKKAVAIAVKNVSGRRRWSKLREWLSLV
jgi:ATP-dependent exoDNAse (exonuclease V) alpha subunit